ncbi:hypothetical protein HNR23_003841 [Nocardiopsis mwathae]|uniref:WD40 repeat domain-containing protein n=1 Tax=Nocardiopsis mwathae TaxID=1472723 RepID=A0A7X0D7J2_9ACTN|nr:hypothetical protein [Nocardiopsis mwathae]MBB6173781.1 hypothetical protein [Nocardiopsis mwathae]
MWKRTVLALPIVCAVLSATPGVALAAIPAPPVTPEEAAERAPEGSEIRFRLEDPRIRESSGLAVSQRHEGVVWTHNDSGDYPAEIYAVDENGATVATVTLTGAGVEARDWEAISLGVGDDGEPAIYVGDIGDNFQGAWPNIRVYRIPEPERLTDQTVEATTFTFTYEDGGRDAEGLMIDPRDNRLYVVSKEIAGGVYAAPETLDPDGANTLTRIDSAPLYATDAAFAPDGSQYAIRTYWGATLYDATDGVPGRSIERITLPKMEQGESLTYLPDGSGLLAGSEGDNSPVWYVPLADAVSPSPSPADPERADTPSPDSPAEADSGGTAGILIGAGVAVAALLIVGIIVLVRRT